MKNMTQLSTIPWLANTPEFERLNKLSKVDTLSAEDRRWYEAELKSRRDLMDVMDFKLMEGHEEGLAKGLAQGRNEGLAEGLVQGRNEGLAQGRILATIQACRDFGKSLEETVVYLRGKLELSEDEARAAVETAWTSEQS